MARKAWVQFKLSILDGKDKIHSRWREGCVMSCVYGQMPNIVYGKDFLFIIRFLRSTTYQITESMQESL